MRNTEELYNLWLDKALLDLDLVLELNTMKEDKEKIFDAFYKDLEFGTGGLRGVIGVGTNRMNVYTVGKATQGLANYINKNIGEKDRRVAIGYDSRIKSEVFARFAATVLAANNIKVFIYPTLMPVPTVSYATRELKCAFGIMVTASHNPSKYNGYKVYGSDGCQVIAEVADAVLEEMNNIDIFNDVKSDDFEKCLDKGIVSFIPKSIYDSFIETVKKESLLKDEVIDKNVRIIYSPLHGSGLKPVTRILKEVGYNNVIVVKEQEEPDGHFTTCPYPNPEIREAMELGIEYAKKYDADLLFATDPDCDRIGIAVKDKNGEFVLLSGNQTGCLLLNYICEMRQKHGLLPKTAVAVKTIVTSELARRIADNYGIKLVDVLTGFKYIGEQIALLEKDNRASDYVFGFEESYGYLSGTYVRDKDAVNGSFLVCEMFSYYKSQGISLLEKLEEFYKKYGYYSNELKSYQFEGASGFETMQNLMNEFRSSVKEIGGQKVMQVIDYAKGVDNLPKSNVIKFVLESGSTVIARPSGTEPKLKIYLSIKGNSIKENNDQIETILGFFDKVCN